MFEDRTKYRDEETWAMVRRAWEGGETAQSCARRFDVGMDNLWRRRAKENWLRRRPEDRPPEPLEGWERHARDKLDAFTTRLAEVRGVATLLARMMAGELIEEAPIWHLGFIYIWRAEHLGPETGEADRERVKARGEPWFDVFWDEAGRLRPAAAMDRALIHHLRDDWRKEAGLPDGAAPNVP